MHLKFKKYQIAIILFSGLFLLNGCSSQNVKPHDVPDLVHTDGTGTGTNGNNNGNGGSTGNTGTGTGYTGGSGGQYSPEDLQNPNSPLSKRVIYFEYDSYKIKAEYLPILEAHAALLAGHSHLRTRLEGHADERGSREYNVALSEQRAKAVHSFMSRNKAGNNQMEVIPFGEEMPATFGHNGGSWRMNRRVEIKYSGE